MDRKQENEINWSKNLYMIFQQEIIHYLGHNIGSHQKGLQVAPQETEVESYIVGGIKQDVKKDTFSGFKL